MYRVLCYSAAQRQKIKAACPTLLGGGQTEEAILTQYCAPFSQVYDDDDIIFQPCDRLRTVL